MNLRPEDAVSTAEVSQFRMVAGVKGDLPFDRYGLENWSWEASASYDRSTGQSRSTRLSDDRIALSIATTIEDPDNPGNFICGLDANGDGIPEQDGNAFLAAVSTTHQIASRSISFLRHCTVSVAAILRHRKSMINAISHRTFNTIIEQTIFQAIATGDLFSTPRRHRRPASSVSSIARTQLNPYRMMSRVLA